ncbi:hypothetical protein JTE90_019940 [Oedothorax gibbosus]|uniref:BTB domain-containing protein n=1 Tax=Oedothorax gibbosus TaxID=931172 RepID=A0AAV6UR94_9ARAC|nr:hypothetical protein JTE90_019940 [Oedothorax gibbosus]
MPTETIIPFILNRFDAELLLGSVLEVHWSLFLTWKRDGRLKSIAVNRTTSSGKVGLEIHLKHTYLDTDLELVSTDKLFVDCLEDGQEETCIAIYLQFPGEFKGRVVLYDANEKIGKYNVTTHFKNLPTAFKHLSDDLSIMFNNPDFFPDASLVCEDTEFLVHKGFLSARSPVFGKMFSTAMLESQGVVKIVGVEASALEFILKYIYSGKTDTLTEELAEDLLFAIDFYELLELKVICVQKLKLQTTVDNVARMLVFGHLHDESLMSYAEKFICEYAMFSEIENTNDWKILEERYESLALRVAKSALRHQEPYIITK